jgi:hypothetical protein
MNSIEFAKLFTQRHTFDEEDQKTLRERWHDVNIFDIPDAWLLIVDEMLSQICKIDYRAIASVGQRCGFLFVSFRDGRERESFLKVVGDAERKLYRIDIDLHKELNDE